MYVFHAMCQSIDELAFGNLIVLENMLHQLCKTLSINIVDAGYNRGVLCNMLNDIPFPE